MDGSGLERLGNEGTPARPRGCPHCQDTRLHRWGRTTRGLARLRCRGCRRTFSPGTGMLACGLRLRAAFERALADMLGAEPSSCRKLGKRLGVHHMTVWRWRIRVLARFAQTLPVSSGEGTGTVCTRESRKASREWVNHARWPALFPARRGPAGGISAAGTCLPAGGRPGASGSGSPFPEGASIPEHSVGSTGSLRPFADRPPAICWDMRPGWSSWRLPGSLSGRREGEAAPRSTQTVDILGSTAQPRRNTRRSRTPPNRRPFFSA